MPRNSNRTKQQQEPSAAGHVTIRLYVPELQRGAARPEGFMINQLAIRKALFTPGSTSNLEDCGQDDILFGRGVVVVPLNGQDPKCFLTFSPEKNQDDHSTNASTSGKWPDGIVIIESAILEWQKGTNQRHDFVGQVSIELYTTWPPPKSEYASREDFSGRVVVSTHSDGADPKWFLTFSFGQSSADRKLLTGEVTRKAGISLGTNLPRTSHDAGSAKRKLSHDGIRSELRRSERLTKRPRT